MWRDFFGKKARIIGIDFNPVAKKWENEGFEIHIGNQSDEGFWNCFFNTVGNVDVVLDDGGHTNKQQIVTTYKTIPHIRNGGLLIIEDIHTSYMKDFGNPSKHSFLNYSRLITDSINSRFPDVHVSNNIFSDIVYSIAYFESIVCFRIDRSKCLVNSSISNEGVTMHAKDFRLEGALAPKINNFLSRQFQRIGIKFSAKHFFNYFETRLANIRLKRYF